ncbi:MAG: valine--tRNA ligase [Desulfovibrionaceae bacterium]
MGKTLEKSYIPHTVETYWRTYWEENHSFKATIDSSKEPYCIVIPPPNVTGSLHMGHALNLTLQDILCRFARQNGKSVLWIPGTDHAGIATQNVVEKMLAKENISRHDLGREKFIEKIWEWKKEYGDKILHQITMMGASVDWSRERFTMDEGLSKAVRTLFVSLYNDGYIYKGNYIINWCSRCSTALADDEVEHVPQKTHLWSIRYPVLHSTHSLVVATTRPETLLGDSALCVHPEDERYAHYIGSYVTVPLTQRVIPVIADSYVDKDFGTGILKVTPAHDHNDWDLGQKHSLESIQVINEHGIMNENALNYEGLHKDDARKAIINDLEQQGFLLSTENLENTVGSCYRCRTIIEPHVSEQWFVASKKLAPMARAAVPQDTSIFPKQWEKTYYAWLDSIRDWCISRQIWWGHRIPAWTCSHCQHITVTIEDPSQCGACGSSSITQETDVLDTWFSSSLWPFSTLGYPEKTKELAYFYPTATLVTGFDILFFWVARMMMMGIYATQHVPFKEVYIHALVRDANGKKMSKSTGNVIDPLVMIERYGTDSLRFTLTSFAAMGRDIKLSEERIEGYRHFVNKLWNATRFVIMNLAPETTTFSHSTTQLPLHHYWILHTLEKTKHNVHTALSTYQFNEAAQILYKFIWNDFCDCFLEYAKVDIQHESFEHTKSLMLTVLEQILIVLHPIMPFITAELFSYLPHSKDNDISKESFPPQCTTFVSMPHESDMLYIQEIIYGIRTIRAELSIAPRKKPTLTICLSSPNKKILIEHYSTHIMSLAGINNIHFVDNSFSFDTFATQNIQSDTIAIHLNEIESIEVEVQRLEKELSKMKKDYEKTRQKLSNPQYLEKVPKDILEKEQNKEKTLSSSIEKVTHTLYKLTSL